MNATPSEIATGRSASLFDADMAASAGDMHARLKGARVLAIGAAGSIGASTVGLLADIPLAALHVVDQNENALAELVRQLRSRPVAISISDFRTLPLDFGTPAMRYLLDSERPYDLVLNFAAIKHVRSEKDAFSIMQMLDTNIVKQARFLGWIGQTSPQADYFSVSTDKAANPASFMGATKRIMEHVLFAQGLRGSLKGRVTSARFANVAFSNGSLLQSFENRLARNEPLAVPEGIERYFVSLEESGQICMLSALFAPGEHIAIPDLDPSLHQVPLRRVATQFLAHHGLAADIYTSETDAIKAAANGRREVAGRFF